MTVTGLYRALVVNTDDPEGLGRVQLQIPQLMGGATSGWALPVTPKDAVPTVGDQVMAAFEGGDLSHPLYHSPGDRTSDDALHADVADFATQAGDADTVDGKNYTDISADIAAAVAPKLNSSVYTAADVLAKTLTVDGAGSGLDADLLDGQQGTYYAKASDVTALSTSTTASTNQILNKGTDLVVNGNGAMGDLTNFEQFPILKKDDAPTGAAAAFVTNVGVQGTLTVTRTMPYDPTKAYQFSFNAKQLGAANNSKFYGFIQFFTGWGTGIVPQYYMFVANTLTTLAAPLNPGDTTVKLTSAANWFGSTAKPAGANTYNRMFIFWDYTDPNGKTWPANTYSQNVTAFDMWADGGVDTTTNTITLKAPWAGAAKPAGTQLSNGTSGGSYVYMPSAANVTVPTTWTTYTSIYPATASWPQGTGANASWPASGAGVPPPPSAAYLKVGWLTNYATPAGSQHAVARVSLSDVAAAAQAAADAAATANAAVKTTVVEYSVNTSETVAPTTGWSTATPTRTAGSFIWTRTTITRGDGTSSTTNPALLTGNTGAAGTPAPVVRLTATTQVLAAPATGGATNPATTTVTGTALNTTITDWTYSVDGGAFSATVPAGVARTTNTVTVTGSTMTARTIAIKAADAAGNGDTLTVAKVLDGAQGTAGKGIASSAVDYQSSSSGTTTPTGTWVSTPPAASPGQYVWTRTVTTFTDSTTSTAYSVGRYGSDGTPGNDGKGITGSAVDYQLSTSGTTIPTGAWTTTVPLATDANPFLWTRTTTTYTDASTSATYSVSKKGDIGTPGNDAYTVLLSNESHSFPGSTSAALDGSTTSTVIAYKGATQIAATIGTITGQVTGLTTAVTSNGTTAPVITLTVTPSLVTKNGTLTIPLTVDGKSFTKLFSWSVSYTGATGATGPTGSTGPTGPIGISVTSVTPYFYQASPKTAAAPATPTTDPPGAGWVTTEPGYVYDTALFRTEKIAYSNSTFAYTAVSKVSSYTASTTAIDSANGRNSIITSTSVAPATGDTHPTTGNTLVSGDIWWQVDTLVARNVQAQWTWSGSAWVATKVTDGVIANLDAAKITTGTLDANRIAANTITADKLIVGGTNLVHDPYYLKLWTASGTARLMAVVDGFNTWQITGTAGQSGTYMGNQTPSTAIDVTPGVYKVSCYVKASVALTSANMVAIYVPGAAMSASSVNSFTLNTGGKALNSKTTILGTTNFQAIANAADAGAVANTWTLLEGQFTVNDGTAKITPGHFVNAALPSGAIANFRGLSITRMAEGSLIVDGAIDGKVITGATIQTEATANKGVKFTSAGINAWDASGVQTIKLAADGSGNLLVGRYQSAPANAGGAAMANGVTVVDYVDSTKTRVVDGVFLGGFDAAGNPPQQAAYVTQTPSGTSRPLEIAGGYVNRTTGGGDFGPAIVQYRRVTNVIGDLFVLADSATNRGGFLSVDSLQVGGKNHGRDYLLTTTAAGTAATGFTEFNSTLSLRIVGQAFHITGIMQVSTAPTAGLTSDVQIVNWSAGAQSYFLETPIKAQAYGNFTTSAGISGIIVVSSSGVAINYRSANPAAATYIRFTANGFL